MNKINLESSGKSHKTLAEWPSFTLKADLILKKCQVAQYGCINLLSILPYLSIFPRIRVFKSEICIEMWPKSINPKIGCVETEVTQMPNLFQLESCEIFFARTRQV